MKASFSGYKNIILIFSLIRTAFLSSYKNNILISSLTRTGYLLIYKNNILVFGLINTAFFTIFFSLYKMVGSDYSPSNNKSSKLSIVAITKNTEMLKFISDSFKTKKR